MAKVLNFFRVIKNNWKKSMVGVGAASYGVSYSKELYDTDQLMRKYCEDVKRYGDTALPTHEKPRHVTVILNPAAKKRKAKKLFEKYCEPLLHLAGISVTIIQTESGIDARNIIMKLDTPTDAILVAGGDGTLSDVLTGLMRKYQASISSVTHCPIGILPLGETNSIANNIYKNYTELIDVRKLIDATMAVINDKTKLMDAIQVEVIEDDPENVTQPIYAMGSVKWGVWKDAETYAKKYWYWGPLKRYMTYVFCGYKRSLNWDHSGTVRYTEPCRGCSSCYQREPSPVYVNKKWWHSFVPKRNILPKENSIDYSRIVNENCGIFHEVPVSTSELCITTPAVDKTGNSEEPQSLKLYLGPKDVDYVSFVSEGWKFANGERSLGDKILDAKDIELHPEKISSNQVLYIDNEEYELKAIRIKLIPRSVKIFHPDVNS